MGIFDFLFAKKDKAINYNKIFILHEIVRPNFKLSKTDDIVRYHEEKFNLVQTYFHIIPKSVVPIKLEELELRGISLNEFRRETLSKLIWQSQNLPFIQEDHVIPGVIKIQFPKHLTAVLYSHRFLEHLRKELKLNQLNWLRIDQKQVYVWQDDVPAESLQRLSELAQLTKSAFPKKFYSAFQHKLNGIEVEQKGDISKLAPDVPTTTKKDSEKEEEAGLPEILAKCRTRAAIVKEGGTVQIGGKTYPMPKNSISYVGRYIDDHAVIFSIDMDNFYTYLTHGQVEKSGATADEIWDKAYQSFLKLFEEKGQIVPHESNSDIYECRLDGNHEASISLYGNIIEHIGSKVGIKNVGWATPSTRSFYFWDADRKDELKDEIIKLCTGEWNAVSHKDRVSIISNTYLLDKKGAMRSFQTIPDKELDPVYLPQHNEVKLGQCLIATEALKDSPFEKKVILIMQKTETHAIGVIINTNQGKALHEMVGIEETEFKVEIGGPAHQEQMIFIHAVEGLGTSNKIMDSLYMNGDSDLMKKMVLNKSIGTEDIRFFAGYCTWSNDQLEAELKTESWKISDIKPSDFMGNQDGDLWTRLSNNEKTQDHPGTVILESNSNLDLDPLPSSPDLGVFTNPQQNIFPVILTSDDPQIANVENSASLFIEDVSEGIKVGYGLYKDGKLTLTSNKLFEKTPMTKEEFKASAHQNLRKLMDKNMTIETMDLSDSMPQVKPFYMLKFNTQINASAMLVDEFWESEKITQLIDTDLIAITIPAKNVMFFSDMHIMESFRCMRASSSVGLEHAQETGHQLSEHTYIRKNGQWIKFLDTEDQFIELMHE